MALVEPVCAGVEVRRMWCMRDNVDVQRPIPMTGIPRPMARSVRMLRRLSAREIDTAETLAMW